MAVAYDNASGSTGVSVSSLSWSHTCAGSERLLIVCPGWYAGSGQTVSSVTYNGVNLTRLGGAVGSGGDAVDIWYLVGPASGANTVQITFSAIVEAAGGALSFTGVSSSTPLGTASTTTFSSATSITVSPSGGTTDDMLAAASAWYPTNATATAISGSTVRVNQVATGNERLVGTTAGGTESSIGSTASSAVGAAMIGVAVKAAGGGGGGGKAPVPRRAIDRYLPLLAS